MRNRKLLVTAFGTLVGLVAAAFVVRTLLVEWDGTKEALSGASWSWMFLSLILATAAMVAVAWVWADVIAALESRHHNRGDFVARYFVGELGKYLPGGIWTVVGRAELARRIGIRRSVAYGSVALSLITLYLAAAGLATALLPFSLASSNSEGSDLRAIFGIGIVLIGGLVVLHPKTLNYVVGIAERIGKRPINVAIPPGRTMTILVLRYVPAWLGIAASSYAVARALTPEVSMPKVALATLASWIAGFIAVPVPAGGGVREAVFLALCGLPAGIGAAVALISRLLFVVVDAIGAGAGSLMLRRSTTPSPLSTEQF